MIRNLLYNCCAPTWTDEWRLNVAKLCSYPRAFNGRKLVIVRTGEEMVPPDEVEAAFTLEGVEFIRLENDPTLHEVAGFVETLSRLRSLDSEEATFYAHTKGSSYRNPLDRRIAAVRQWRDAMYDGCLGDLSAVEHALQTHATAGCMLQDVRGESHDQVAAARTLMPGTKWHYAGTFWWAKHSSLFGHPSWQTIPACGRYGVEAYLGSLFDASEALGLNETPRYGLYSNLGVYACANCGHQFTFREHRMTSHPIKACPSCHKRRGEYVRPTSPRISLPMRPLENAVHLRSMCAELIQPHHVVAELGCYYGESTLVFSEFAAAVHAVDPWAEEYLTTSDVAGRPGRESMAEVESIFDELTASRSNIRKVKAVHEEAVHEFADGSLDLVYCDAVHTEEATEKAIAAWLPKVRYGGHLAGHDYVESFPGVIAAVDRARTDSFKLWGDGNWAFQP